MKKRVMHEMIEAYLIKRGFSDIHWHEGQGDVVIGAKNDGNFYCMKAADIVNLMLRAEAHKK